MGFWVSWGGKFFLIFLKDLRRVSFARFLSFSLLKGLLGGKWDSANTPEAGETRSTTIRSP